MTRSWHSYQENAFSLADSLIGCGGMSGSHKLWEKELRLFDIDANRAKERAGQAHDFQGGPKPAVYTAVEEMLAKSSNLDCVDICAPHTQRRQVYIGNHCG